MTAPPPFAARPLEPIDVDAAAALAREVGVHGVYVGNHLRGCGDDGGEVLALCGRDRLLGLAFFGSRGNLILIQRAALDPAAVARAVRDAGWTWRIALGPGDTVAALRELEPRPPLVHRRQLYCGVAPTAVPDDRVRADVRHAQRRDQARLLAAALHLNEVDLAVDPSRVHRPWLKDSIRRRIRAAQTQVIGAPGDLTCKLDIGSRGPYGVVVEGVYTFPEVRGRGLASGLVATVAARADAPLVCLHVAADNLPAVRAYRSAGMAELGDCHLLLRG